MWNPRIVMGIVVFCAIIAGALWTIDMGVAIFLDAPSLLLVLGISVPLGWLTGRGDLSLALRRMADHAVPAGWVGAAIGVVASARAAHELDQATSMIHFSIAILPMLYGYSAKILLGFASDVIRSDSPEPS